MFRTQAVLGLVDEMFVRWRRYRAEVRTRRAIGGLSHHMRKDIGWPDPLPDRHGRRSSSGEWRL